MKQGTIEKIVNGGWGLVRSDEGVVFLNYVLPGETVMYRIRERARGVLWGEVIDILTPSPHRVPPPCPYYGQCGGCVFQHIEYEYQEEIKRSILQDDLQRIGGYEGELPPILPSPPFHNRVRARMKGYDDGRIGFIRKGTNTVVPIDNCLLFPPEINTFIKKWNAQPEPPFFHQMDILFNPDDRKVYVHLSKPPRASVKPLLEQFQGVTFTWRGREESGVSSLTIKDQTYYVSPDVFFQVNPHQWEPMLDTVREFLDAGETGGNGNTMIDLYCGVGFFIPLLQERAEQVIGVESYGFSIDLAKRAFGSGNVEFYKTPAEKFYFPEAHTLILDPPRSGLSRSVLNRILDRKYRRVIYISCASAAFSRDMKIMREAGYRLDQINVFDLFPQTSHLETISNFQYQE